MNKKKEIVPKLRFPEFANEDKWKNKRIEQLLTIGNGCDYKHLSKGDIPVYGSGGYMCSVDDFLYDGDSVCIGRKGTIDKPIFLRGKFWTVDTLFYTHSYKNCIPKFIYNIFQRINWLKYNEAGGVPSLSKTTINKINIYIPKIPEQQKIADCLSSIDELIDAESRKLKALEKYKKGLLQKLFPAEGKNIPEWRFPEFQGCGEWEICTVKDSFNTITPPKKIAKSEYKNSGKYPIVDQSQEYIAGWTDDETAIVSYHRSLIVFGDHTCVLKFISQPFVQGADGIKILSTDYKLDEKFAYYCLENIPLNSNGYQRHYSTLKEFVIKFPDRNSGEQQKIADCLSEVDTIIQEQSNKVKQLKAHKKGLMQGLFPSLEEADV